MPSEKNARKFNWVSSLDPQYLDRLNKLNERMVSFYANQDRRKSYQLMLDSIDNDLTNPGPMVIEFIKYLKEIRATSFIEVGCGGGRVFQFLNEEFSISKYLGIEVSESIVERNKSTYKSAEWAVGGAYDIPALTDSFQVCFSFYVLEHLVFPERALNEMMRVVEPEGFLILIFPDFVRSKRFASQHLGLSNQGNAINKIKQGKIIDGLVSLYDSRLRLPLALDNVVSRVGRFPVNLSPRCLDCEVEMLPDIDAVYIASKSEIVDWANQNGYKFSLPRGADGFFSEHAFVVIQKKQPKP